jgi:hypothetical protein
VTAVLLKLPEAHIGDVSGGLRRLADQIDAGEYGDAHAFAWVVDCGGHIEVGMLGQTAEAGAVAHLLLALGMRKLEVSE